MRNPATEGGADLLAGDHPLPTKSREEAQLRARLLAAADYGREKIADTGSPCARDLCWYLVRLAESADQSRRLQREVQAAEHLWRAALEVERLEARG